MISLNFPSLTNNNNLTLLIALHVVGVENGQKVITDRYPELVQEETINKVTFVYVLEEEHKRVGFSYNIP